MSSERVVVIEKRNNVRMIDWRELSAYKDLLYFLVVRGIKAKYAQSILGVGWAIIQPLFTMLIFTIVFGRLAGIQSDGVPYALFSFCGLIPWMFFSGVITEASASLISNTNMMSKVYFPRLVLPLSAMLGKYLDFCISMLVLAGLLLFFQFLPSTQIIYLPLLIVLLGIVSIGPSIILAAWSIQYRDIKYAMTFLVQLLMYAAPVVYPLSNVPSEFQLVYSINPMVGVIGGFRAAILGTREMPWLLIGMSTAISSVILVLALVIFSKLEKTFADVS